MTKVCVVGGGVAGLSAAYYAMRQGAGRVVVLESSPRLGGWIHSSRVPDTGVIVEGGPRTVRPAGQAGANTLALVQELGLAGKVRPVKYGHPATTNRLVLVDGKLNKLPSSLSSVFSTMPPFSRPLVASVMKDLLTAKLPSEDVSLYDFVSRRLGEEVAQYAIDPMVRGICAGDSRVISVHFIAGYLHRMEQKAGRVTLGVLWDMAYGLMRPSEASIEEQCDLTQQARKEKWAMWSLQGGLETLVKTLAESLRMQGVEIKTGVSVESVQSRGSSVQVVCEGETSSHDHLVLATPAFHAASLLDSMSGELASCLSSIPFVSTAVTNIEYQGNVLPHEGFGFLVPSSQPEPILGCIYDTCTFPQGRDRTLLTVMQGGAWYDQVVGDLTEGEVGQVAVETVQRVLGITTPPVWSRTRLLPNCIAQYTVGHLARVGRARQILEGLGAPVSLVGSSYDGVGINDTIMSSKKAVASLAVL